MGTLHLSDTVSYLDDIQPNLLTMLYAGVGSGKNHFINQLITGHTDKRHDGTEVKLDPLYVLLITSRRSKVNELLTEDDLPLDNKVGKWNWFRQRISIPSYIPIAPTDKQITLESQYGKQPYYPRSFACTNAFIERYLQHVYHPQDITTHLWELFDLIVVDEAHSLVMDASYQSAPFYVDDLIREFCARHKTAEADPEHHKAPRCKNLLMMTGSVSSMKMYDFPVAPHVIDRMDECINVVPANIHFMTSAEAKAQLSKQLVNDEKAVYFTNHTPKIDDFLEGTSIDPSTVAVSFSKQEARDKLAKDAPDSFKRMEQVEESIAKDNLIPDDIHLWLTTSRNSRNFCHHHRTCQHNKRRQILPAIPNRITDLPYGVFGNCFSLESVTVPPSVTSIDDGTFAETPLSTLTVYCEQESATHKFCDKNNIKYKFIKEFFVSHDGFDAVLQGGDLGIQFFAHALQVEDLVDGVFQGGITHVGVPPFHLAEL